MSVVKKKKHVSKKNKKAWRKHCDIRDVEDFLEEQRLDERLGKFETKPDSELFVVDTGGKLQEDNAKPLSAKLQKRAKLSEVPKCFEILLPTSKVPDPNAKRNHVNPIGFKPTSLSKLTDKRRFQKGVYQRKIDDARKSRKIALEKKRKAKQVKHNFTTDLWGVECIPESKGIPSTLVDDFISPEAQLHNVLTEKRMRPKPSLANTVVTQAALELPHPGVSYNPSFKEHQELLQEVVQHEEKMMKRETHLHRVTTAMFSKVSPKEQQSQWQEEMSVGLTPSNPAEDSSTDDEYKSVNPPVKNKKKDHKTRRKQKERLVEKERLKREKIDKQKITDIYKLRKIQSSIVAAERRQLEERERLSERAAAEPPPAPALSAHKTPRREPDFIPPEQLSGDLRNINSNTNLLRDRFESFQRRGALAASKLMMKKKRKLKSYFKAGHKVTEQDIQRYTNRSAGKK